MPRPHESLDAARRRRGAALRVVLGNAQMFLAVVGLGLLVFTGVNVVSVGTVAGAGALALTSIWLFRKRE